MNNIHMKKGFTLIELLVVIAIIGILASVVIASVGGTRAQAKDANARAELKSLQVEAELQANRQFSSYTDVCSSDGVQRLKRAVEREVRPNLVTCVDSGSSYAAEVQLNDESYHCTDSNGYTGPSTGSVIGGGSACEENF